MDILFYSHNEDPAPWLTQLRQALPAAGVRAWSPADDGRADYALVWNPPVELLRGRVGLKAVFNLGAGVDALMALLHAHRDALAPEVAVIRVEGGGMGEQMAQYVVHAVLRHHRRFDHYALQQVSRRWRPRAPLRARDCPVGILGAGAMAALSLGALGALGYPLRCWSRSGRAIADVACFAGAAQLSAFLDGLQVLVNLLPLTAQTRGILDRKAFQRLARGAALVNVARGGHLVEAELLAALDEGLLASATLDVFADEPLPADHPLWTHPRVTVTPHIAAQTLREESVAEIVAAIEALECGEPVRGRVDLARGY